MNIKNLLKNFSIAFVAQSIAMLSSIIVTLMMPKVLGVEAFGYWQLFIFYSTYVGFFHFGINDGVYLIFGGKTRDFIDKTIISSQFYLTCAIQTFWAILIAGISFLCDLQYDRGFVICATAIYLFSNNLAFYIGYVFQAMNETRLFSYSSIIDRFIFILPMVVMLVLRVDTFEPYIVAHCLASIVRLLFCLYFFRDFLLSKRMSFVATLAEAVRSIKIGVKLMIANVASMLILGAGRIIIDARWGIEEFGKFSLCLSMVTFFLNFVSQVSMVLFPALRQTSSQYVSKFYYLSNNLMGLILPVAYLLYFPASYILSLWLPEYQSSLVYLSYLLPICVFDSKMNIACSTLMKVNREETTLLNINILAVFFSLSFAIIGAYFCNSVNFVIFGMVGAVVFRSILSEYIMAYKLRVKTGIISFEAAILSVIFICSSMFLRAGYAVLVYIISYGCFILSNSRTCIEVFKQIKKICSK